MSRQCWLGWVVATAGLFGVTMANAETPEAGSNDSCATAQVVADTVVTGELTAGDVDFYRVTGLLPGRRYLVHVRGHFGGGGTLVDPILGKYDPQDCVRTGFADRGGAQNFDARGSVFVAESGETVLAVATNGNYAFAQGRSTATGTYRLEVLPALAFGVKATLVDRYTRDPLAGVGVGLHRCYNEACTSSVNTGVINSGPDGTVSFPGQIGAAGEHWRLLVSAQGEYRPVDATRDFVLAADRRFYGFGEVALERPPLRIASTVSCTGAQPGVPCNLAVRIENRRTQERAVRAWTTVYLYAAGATPAAYMPPGGETGPASVIATLAPAATTEIVLPLVLPPNTEAGRRYFVRVHVAPPGDPAHPYFGYEFFGNTAPP